MKYVVFIENTHNTYTPSCFIKEDGFLIKTFNQNNKELAIDFINKHNILLVVIDTFVINNPVEYKEKLKKDISIIVITDKFNDIEFKKHLYNNNISDILNTEFIPSELNIKITNMAHLQILKIHSYSNIELSSEIKKAHDILLKREQETLNILGKTAEWKDPETANHVARVAHYSRLLAKKAGLDELYQEKIFFAAPFHDIGKVGIPDEVLLKPGKLTEKEFTVMKEHSSIGYNILKDSDSIFLQMGAEISLSHHEKWNGTGYPYGLSGNAIPLSGRIVAIVDVFDALTSSRPYKAAWSFEDALSFLSDESSIHFDPILVEVFKNNLDDILKIYYAFQ